MNFFKRKLVLALLVLLGGSIFGVALWRYKIFSNVTVSKELHGIVDFNYERDRVFISDIFDKNWYWLIDDVSSPNFSVEYMLRYLTTNSNPSTAGRLTIKVLYEDNKAAGFTAYYMKQFYWGQIRFVAVSQEFRSKGYGRMLVEYALKDLKARGAAKVTLVTRTTNIPAQKAYKASGMTVFEEDENFVWFEKKFDKA